MYIMIKFKGKRGEVKRVRVKLSKGMEY
jgi:hypothetical protein